MCSQTPRIMRMAGAWVLENIGFGVAGIVHFGGVFQTLTAPGHGAIRGVRQGNVGSPQRVSSWWTNSYRGGYGAWFEEKTDWRDGDTVSAGVARGTRGHVQAGALGVGLAILSVAYCMRVSEAASVRSIALVQDEAYVQFYDFQTKD